MTWKLWMDSTSETTLSLTFNRRSQKVLRNRVLYGAAECLLCTSTIFVMLGTKHVVTWKWIIWAPQCSIYMKRYFFSGNMPTAEYLVKLSAAVVNMPLNLVIIFPLLFFSTRRRRGAGGIVIYWCLFWELSSWWERRWRGVSSFSSIQYMDYVAFSWAAGRAPGGMLQTVWCSLVELMPHHTGSEPCTT